jgi:hypothetical protein
VEQSENQHDDSAEIAREERIIYLLLALVGLPIAILALVEHRDFDAGSTISLACVVLAIAGLVHLVRRRPPRLPPAHLRRHAGGLPLRPRGDRLVR